MKDVRMSMVNVSDSATQVIYHVQYAAMLINCACIIVKATHSYNLFSSAQL